MWVLSCKFHQHRLSGFRDVRGGSLPFPIAFGLWLIQQLAVAYHTSRDDGDDDDDYYYYY